MCPTDREEDFPENAKEAYSYLPVLTPWVFRKCPPRLIPALARFVVYGHRLLFVLLVFVVGFGFYYGPLGHAHLFPDSPQIQFLFWLKRTVGAEHFYEWYTVIWGLLFLLYICLAWWFRSLFSGYPVKVQLGSVEEDKAESFDSLSKNRVCFFPVPIQVWLEWLKDYRRRMLLRVCLWLLLSSVLYIVASQISSKFLESVDAPIYIGVSVVAISLFGMFWDVEKCSQRWGCQCRRCGTRNDIAQLTKRYACSSCGMGLLSDTEYESPKFFGSFKQNVAAKYSDAAVKTFKPWRVLLRAVAGMAYIFSWFYAVFVGFAFGFFYLALLYPESWGNDLFRGLLKQGELRLLYLCLPGFLLLGLDLFFQVHVDYLKALALWEEAKEKEKTLV